MCLGPFFYPFIRYVDAAKAEATTGASLTAIRWTSRAPWESPNYGSRRSPERQGGPLTKIGAYPLVVAGFPGGEKGPTYQVGPFLVLGDRPSLGPR